MCNLRDILTTKLSGNGCSYTVSRVRIGGSGSTKLTSAQTMT